jgi:hypothetical protein
MASGRFPIGAVAQLGERGVRNAEVGSSILLRSSFPACGAIPGLRRLCSTRQSQGLPCRATVRHPDGAGFALRLGERGGGSAGDLYAK